MPQQPPTSDDLLTRTLDTIAAERDDADHSFRLVDNLLAAWGEANLAARLYDAVPQARPWEHVADLFGFLIWSTSDNGAALMRTMEQWLLVADDVRQVHVALHLDVYPFEDRGDMERVLRRVAERWPQAAAKCAELISSRPRHERAGA